MEPRERREPTSVTVDAALRTELLSTARSRGMPLRDDVPVGTVLVSERNEHGQLLISGPGQSLCLGPGGYSNVVEWRGVSVLLPNDDEGTPLVTAAVVTYEDVYFLLGPRRSTLTHRIVVTPEVQRAVRRAQRWTGPPLPVGREIGAELGDRGLVLDIPSYPREIAYDRIRIVRQVDGLLILRVGRRHVVLPPGLLDADELGQYLCPPVVPPP